ncbi:MAG: hypothetical protein IIB90_14065 [Gemmatimonadetes bacterium]|nr:hypothetical protein [Gemmatimonadota bacterium]
MKSRSIRTSIVLSRFLPLAAIILFTAAYQGVEGPSRPVSQEVTFQSVSAGVTHSCGVTTAGKAYCWGGGTNGELGDGASSSSSVPVKVTGGLSFRSLNAGAQHTCGVTTTGVAYCWGLNPVGQLGNGSIISSNVPVRVVDP